MFVLSQGKLRIRVGKISKLDPNYINSESLTKQTTSILIRIRTDYEGPETSWIRFQILLEDLGDKKNAENESKIDENLFLNLKFLTSHQLL